MHAAVEKQTVVQDPDIALMLRVRDDEPGAFDLTLGRHESHDTTLAGSFGHSGRLSHGIEPTAAC